jgi:hypothetical protein
VKVPFTHSILVLTFEFYYPWNEKYISEFSNTNPLYERKLTERGHSEVHM